MLGDSSVYKVLAAQEEPPCNPKTGEVETAR